MAQDYTDSGTYSLAWANLELCLGFADGTEAEIDKAALWLVTHAKRPEVIQAKRHFNLELKDAHIDTQIV
jgi:hypothetical protein